MCKRQIERVPVREGRMDEDGVGLPAAHVRKGRIEALSRAQHDRMDIDTDGSRSKLDLRQHWQDRKTIEIHPDHVCFPPIYACSKDTTLDGRLVPAGNHGCLWAGDFRSTKPAVRFKAGQRTSVEKSAGRFSASLRRTSATALVEHTSMRTDFHTARLGVCGTSGLGGAMIHFTFGDPAPKNISSRVPARPCGKLCKIQWASQFGRL